MQGVTDQGVTGRGEIRDLWLGPASDCDTATDDVDGDPEISSQRQSWSHLGSRFRFLVVRFPFFSQFLWAFQSEEDLSHLAHALTSDTGHKSPEGNHSNGLQPQSVNIYSWTSS